MNANTINADHLEQWLEKQFRELRDKLEQQSREIKALKAEVRSLEGDVRSLERNR